LTALDDDGVDRWSADIAKGQQEVRHVRLRAPSKTLNAITRRPREGDSSWPS
jgi:hypothetical protein